MFCFPISDPLMVHLMLHVRPKQVHPHAYVYIINCGLLLSPAILISRLLLRMRRMYVASIRLDFHQECTERTLITHVRLKQTLWRTSRGLNWDKKTYKSYKLSAIGDNKRII